LPRPPYSVRPAGWSAAVLSYLCSTRHADVARSTCRAFVHQLWCRCAGAVMEVCGAARSSAESRRFSTAPDGQNSRGRGRCGHCRRRLGGCAVLSSVAGGSNSADETVLREFDTDEVPMSLLQRARAGPVAGQGAPCFVDFAVPRLRNGLGELTEGHPSKSTTDSSFATPYT
jgi:hypothetical protein